MPRLTHAIPKYRKHRASGQAVVTIAKVEHCLGPHGTKASYLQYDRLILPWRARGALSRRFNRLLTRKSGRSGSTQADLTPDFRANVR